MYTRLSALKNHRLYEDYTAVKNRLLTHQFVCWIAGGAVRDFCLGREVHEFDLATDATTEVLKLLFPEAVLVGESFGVLKIPARNSGKEGDFFDLATFRQESDYADGRRPSMVAASTPWEDAKRRDFTVNSMFWNGETGRIVDYQSGFTDLENKLLKCVGDPLVRFGEDHLRILRLVRFAAVLGLEIDPETYRAALQLKSKIVSVSGERISAELKKIKTPGAWNFALKKDLFTGVLQEVFGKPPRTGVEITLNQISFEMAVHFLYPDSDMSDVLKKRLKLSNLEVESYRALRFLLTGGVKLGTAELACLIESSQHTQVQWEFLLKVGALDVENAKKIKNLLAEFPAPLILGREMKGVIPDKHISEELKILRLRQFSRTLTTKGDALAYLKKKYA